MGLIIRTNSDVYRQTNEISLFSSSALGYLRQKHAVSKAFSLRVSGKMMNVGLIKVKRHYRAAR